MRISASYNYPNGEEHFLASVRAVRSVIDHISVVWQEISNAGEPITANARQALQAAVDEGLVDETISYAPDLSVTRRQNETTKRRLGLEAARSAGATHFLSLDTDEFYRPAEVEKARRLIAQEGWESTSVSSFLHVRRPVWRSPDLTRCCFITRIQPGTQIGVRDFPSPYVDPTRRMTARAETHYHFPVEAVAMYHMNLVRRDLAQKLRNSSTTDPAFLDEVASAIAAWLPGTPLDFPRKGALHFDYVQNEFNTYDPRDGQIARP